MFVNEELQDHLETSSRVKVRSAVIAEWNMNMSNNIFYAGNYRYRPNDEDFPEYNNIAQSFSTADSINRFYTGATDADVVIDGGLDNDDTPTAFVSKKEKERLLYSLEDCFGRFRPRSGINKLRYFEGNYSHFSNINMTRRPRYYVSTKLDGFKYWTSYRTEEGIERGIANINLNGQNFIHDAAPFVVYDSPVPANRVVIKMQTNVGNIDLGPFIGGNEVSQDPFFGEANQTTPIRWKVQSLDASRNWVDLSVFDQNSVREDGSPIIGSDGYVELAYGLIIPPAYKENFKIVAECSSANLIPDPTNLPNGTAYFVQENTNDPGSIYVVRNTAQKNQGTLANFDANYGWGVFDQIASDTGFVKNLTNPPSFTNDFNGTTQYREFEYLYGLRIVVETMNVFDSTFDLIELSPRLTADISDSVLGFNVTKTASDLGNAGLPVGQLLASVGTLDIFDVNQAFFPENPNSIVKDYTSQNLQLKFYEVVEEVNDNFYYVPIKTMYSEGFPQIQSDQKTVSLSLRDLFFYFESLTAPQIIVQNASLSYAISLILDAIGFSNYTFRRNENEGEEIIPYFFVPPDVSVAEVLNNIAISTQSVMFFDELNNLVVMSRDYFLPRSNERATDLILRGSVDFEKDGTNKNSRTSTKLSNIIDISFRNNQIFNDGVIKYETRSIQRSYGSTRQATLVDRNKTWIYKPALLWEVSGSENTKSVNEESGTQSSYVLSAIPLNSNLRADVPVVENHRVINNVMDFGDGIYWIARYDGYFYANGEMIKYDAVQYNVPGISGVEQNDPNVEGDNIWITSVEEYQKYFAKIPFNGKMYPTGLVRIYSEPNFEVVGGQTRLKNGPVAKHGRGQFGTTIVHHSAGLDSYWSDRNNIKGCSMDAKYIFDESIRRLVYTNSTLVSNEGNAVIQVIDATTARVGDYVEKFFKDDINQENNPEAEGERQRNIIPENTRIIGVETYGDDSPETETNFVVTVQSTSEGNKYYFNGELHPTLFLAKGRTYTFDQSDSSNVGHSLYLSTTLNGHHELGGTVAEAEYTDGTNYTGTVGTDRLLTFTVPSNAPETLYYVCVNHSGMAGDSQLNILTGINQITLSNTVRLLSDKDFLGLIDLDGSVLISNGENPIIEVENTEGLEEGLYIQNSFSSATSNIVPENTQIVSIDSVNNRITISNTLEEPDSEFNINLSAGRIKFNSLILVEKAPDTTDGKAGIETSIVQNTSTSGVIKNILTNTYLEETNKENYYPGTIQSSALVLRGNTVNTTEDPKNFISYIHKPLENRFRHFGTRARIIGRVENDETRGQTPEGGSVYYTIEQVETGQSPVLVGGSGGMAIMVNPETNNGYYFEIAALTENNLDNYVVDGEVYNVYFYRLDRNVNAESNRDNAIPTRLFGGIAEINVDDGTFVGQSRMANEDSPTVYDMAVEYEDINNIRRFYLYLNNRVIAVVDDENPLPVYNNMALFVRGNAKIMFENVYALTNNYSQNSVFSIDTPINSVFGVDNVNAQDTFQKYSMNGLVQATYLKGISSAEPPKYNMYFEEFGTIMREASYFDVRYDKAFPALSAQLSPTFSRLKGYTSSGFLASAYGAEFLVFNHTDTALSLDSSSGNYLRIQGVTFTEQSSNELTVDDYYQKKSNFADPQFVSETFVESPVDAKADFVDIKLNRISEGRREFTIEAPYIQTQSHAERLMDWLVDKIMKPRQSVGMRVFAMPILQLGDIVQIDYINKSNFNEISDSNKRYVVYSINYVRQTDGPSMEVFLSEVT